ncbi:diguanylate cyclase [Shewanella sp. NFH-SH190041]|uniref:sensor domain-containing diguanylate cyclase n=1 Tax=Shewanella sp. NFH-SH190041 TaxID=2950245 RepID=UPI0021C3D696|nr:sensor domain-containing diguanylate cyclase [Shewanella sp. NFH-SH190041]BDM63893.1 diguanylate cyclase [Shewanella sp. NFH-SH190041]
MKLAHHLLLQVFLGLLLTLSLVFALQALNSRQHYALERLAHITRLEQQLDMLRAQLWRLQQYSDHQALENMRTEQRSFNHLLTQTRTDTARQVQLLRILLQTNAGLGRLLDLTDSTISRDRHDAATGISMQLSHYSMAFQTMTETLFQLQHRQIAASRNQQQGYLYFKGAALLTFTLLLLGSAAFTYHRFKRNLTLLNHGITALGKGDLSSKLTLPHKDELWHLAGAFNQMKHSLEHTTIQKDQLSFAVAQQTQQLQQQQDKLRYLAEHDDLTGLYSRSAFNRLLDTALKRSERQHAQLAVIFIDLDKFKQINDSYGHGAGDAVLVEFSERLRQLLRKSDIIARFGGDEFVLLLEPVTSRSKLNIIAQKLLQCAEQPVNYKGLSLTLHLSLGISLYPQDGHSAEELLLNADDAMYQAKAKGGSNWVFASEEANN